MISIKYHKRDFWQRLKLSLPLNVQKKTKTKTKKKTKKKKTKKKQTKTSTPLRLRVFRGNSTPNYLHNHNIISHTQNLKVYLTDLTSHTSLFLCAQRYINCQWQQKRRQRHFNIMNFSLSFALNLCISIYSWPLFANLLAFYL